MDSTYARRAWAGLIAYILVVEVMAPDGQMLSHAYDRGLSKTRGKILLTTVTGVTAAHLLNLIPSKIDPFVLAFSFKEKNRRSRFRDN